MVSRIWLINAVLALLVAFFGLKAYGVWFQEDKGNKIPEMTQNPIQTIAKPLRISDKGKIPLESEYDALMALNLFSPERIEILPDETNPKEGKETITTVQQKNLEQNLKRITLYGMVITEDSAEALVSDIAVASTGRVKRALGRTKTTKPKVRKVKWIKVGDSLGEFQVAEIKPDGILLKAGSMTFDLPLYDRERVKRRAPVRPKAGPTLVGIVGKKPPTTEGETKKKTLPIPVAKGTAPPKTAPGETGTYEDFLKRTGNKKQLELYQNKKKETVR
jgi:hypothetical protein